MWSTYSKQHLALQKKFAFRVWFPSLQSLLCAPLPETTGKMSACYCSFKTHLTPLFHQYRRAYNRGIYPYSSNLCRSCRGVNSAIQNAFSYLIMKQQSTQKNLTCTLSLLFFFHSFLWHTPSHPTRTLDPRESTKRRKCHVGLLESFLQCSFLVLSKERWKQHVVCSSWFACGNLEKTHRWPYLGLETNGASMGEGWNKGNGGVFVRSCGKRWSWFVTLCASRLLSCPVSWYYIVVQGKRSVSPTKQVMMAKWSPLLGRGRTHGFPVCDRAWYQGIIFQATKDMPTASLKKFIKINILHDMIPSPHLCLIIHFFHLLENSDIVGQNRGRWRMFWPKMSKWKIPTSKSSSLLLTLGSIPIGSSCYTCMNCWCLW